MDLDIEMDDAADAMQQLPDMDLPHDDILQPDEPEEPGEVADDEPQSNEAQAIVPNKVHIQGLDTLHTDDVKSFVKSHFGPVDRVEWIDDTSANLVFASEPTARDAIVSLATVDIADPTALPPGESLPAKPFEGKPEISLHVRFALESDKKEAGAAQRSRYYLLHPEHDPEEKRRRRQEERVRYRDRDGGYRRNGGRRRRDSDDEVETFEASMYDDVPSSSRRRRRSESPDDTKSYADENKGKELFSGRRIGRDRSASPRRDLYDDDEPMGRERASSASNRTSARSIKERLSSSNRSKELFPSKSTTSRRGGGGQLDQLEAAIGSARLKEEDHPRMAPVPRGPSGGSAFNIRGMATQHGEGDEFAIKGAASGISAKELFPDKFGGSNVGKELLDMNRSKRRHRAEDLFS